MMKKKIIILTSLLFSTGISAQETLTLEQCREMALKYNKEMAASTKQTESARYTAKSYKGNFFPNFTLSGTGIYSTADGSFGAKGYPSDLMGELEHDYFYACGPEPMFRAIEAAARTSGQYSFEERMGCGFGACMGCTCRTKYGNKRICKDGPVLMREEVIW